MIAVNPSSKRIYLSALESLLNDLDQAPAGQVSVPTGEPIMLTITQVVDRNAFVKLDDGSTSYMSVS